jgi:hypothetical protein
MWMECTTRLHKVTELFSIAIPNMQFYANLEFKSKYVILCKIGLNFEL